MMKKYIFDLNPADSEAANPCPSLFGEDSGTNRAVIAGWKKGVLNQASPSRTTDFGIFRKFRIIRNIRNMRNITSLAVSTSWSAKYVKTHKTFENNDFYKCLNTCVATSCWRGVYLNKRILRKGQRWPELKLLIF